VSDAGTRGFTAENTENGEIRSERRRTRPWEARGSQPVVSVSSLTAGRRDLCAEKPVSQRRRPLKACGPGKATKEGARPSPAYSAEAASAAKAGRLRRAPHEASAKEGAEVAARLLAFRTSFRPRSNSSRLLEEAIEGAREAGSSAEVVDLPRTRIKPCTACDACIESGRCVFEDDDFCRVLDRMLEAERILVATPVYFMAAPAQLKLLIDRTQCLYNRKYVRKERMPKELRRRRRGGVIAVSGSKLENAFDGLDLTMRYFFDALEMKFAERLYVGHVDEQGEIERHPERLREARELGRRLVED
jgi:multimeric flavodoxin WrbA